MITPTLTPMTLPEAALMLQGLYLVDLHQLENGYAPILRSLRAGSAGHGRRLRYIRDDPDETWLNIRDIWNVGGGDCEDLAAAVAAGFTHGGILARPIIGRTGKAGLYHARVQFLQTVPGLCLAGELYDPSRVGGMGEADELAEHYKRIGRRALAQRRFGHPIAGWE